MQKAAISRESRPPCQARGLSPGSSEIKLARGSAEDQAEAIACSIIEGNVPDEIRSFGIERFGRKETWH